MKIVCFAAGGFEGDIVTVEADLRRSIPGFDLVGLPDGAVKEARERVRAALRNSGFTFPRERVLINLSPAGVRKEGAAFDLSIALTVLLHSGQVPANAGPYTENTDRIMALGELNLSGRIQPVAGILAAVIKAGEAGIPYVIVPMDNVKEAEAPGCANIIGVENLRSAVATVQSIRTGNVRINPSKRRLSKSYQSVEQSVFYEDISDIRGHRVLKRALEIAASGRHNMLIFGPPGSGKTMAARRFPSILPPLKREESIEVSKIYSIAGKLGPQDDLVRLPPFRAPHHSASQEGLIGGGKGLHPGEISFAHKGILFLDEAPEFNKSILQSLREPLEEGKVYIVRASMNYWFPADFQLIMAANPCPCGNLGRDDKICMCGIPEIEGYWKKIGGPLLDRIDLRVPTEAVPAEIIFSSPGEKSEVIKNRVRQARSIQETRYGEFPFSCNARIPAGIINRFCGLTEEGETGFAEAAKKFGLSSRACHSVLKIARTIADMAGAGKIEKEHLFEAVQYRRYGDGDYFWSERF